MPHKTIEIKANVVTSHKHSILQPRDIDRFFWVYVDLCMHLYRPVNSLQRHALLVQDLIPSFLR